MLRQSFRLLVPLNVRKIIGCNDSAFAKLLNGVFRESYVIFLLTIKFSVPY